MKRAVVFIFIITFILGISVCAAEEKAYVTVSNGDVVFANKEVILKDADGDGKITLNDALISAHTNPDDYGYENTEYGISMTKLCGVENGGAYGYYHNNAPAMSLSDEISNGDTVYAFVYVDTVSFSDTYCYFESSFVSASKDKEITLTLMQGGYDANWEYRSSPLSDAVITVNGEKTEYKTDENGNVKIKTDTAGKITVSAVCEGKTIVPPVCTVNVTDNPQTSDCAVVIFALLTVSLYAFVFTKRVRCAK